MGARPRGAQSPPLVCVHVSIVCLFDFLLQKKKVHIQQVHTVLYNSHSSATFPVPAIAIASL